jgi:hypothetical protein
MSWFKRKTKAEKLLEEQLREAKELEKYRLKDIEKQNREEFMKKIENLDKFPGSLDEYIAFRGLEYEIMDTGRPQKFVSDSFSFGYYDDPVLKKVVVQGCEALIRYNLNRDNYGNRSFGIPVKRK